MIKWSRKHLANQLPLSAVPLGRQQLQRWPKRRQLNGTKIQHFIFCNVVFIIASYACVCSAYKIIENVRMWQVCKFASKKRIELRHREAVGNLHAIKILQQIALNVRLMSILSIKT